MGLLLIRISVIYLLIGTVLGMYMSIVEDFALSSVHTHISLLGWTTMTLAGIIYHIFQNLTKSVLCKIQFILFNIGLPIPSQLVSVIDAFVRLIPIATQDLVQNFGPVFHLLTSVPFIAGFFIGAWIGFRIA